MLLLLLQFQNFLQPTNYFGQLSLGNWFQILISQPLLHPHYHKVVLILCLVVLASTFGWDNKSCFALMMILQQVISNN
jgi:hypothetical protein